MDFCPSALRSVVFLQYECSSHLALSCSQMFQMLGILEMTSFEQNPKTLKEKKAVFDFIDLIGTVMYFYVTHKFILSSFPKEDTETPFFLEQILNSQYFAPMPFICLYGRERRYSFLNILAGRVSVSLLPKMVSQLEIDMRLPTALSRRENDLLQNNYYAFTTLRSF